MKSWKVTLYFDTYDQVKESQIIYEIANVCSITANLTYHIEEVK